MWALLLNLLILYTKCIVITNDRKITIEWIFKRGSFTLNLIAPEGMRIIRTEKNTIRLAPYYLKKKTHLHRLKQWLRWYLRTYGTGLPMILNMLE
jgi:hypothetical protein